MYRTIIEIDKNVTPNTLEDIKDICISAHKNRAGKVDIKELSDYKFAFEGEEKDYGCLQLGNLALNKVKTFKDNLLTWRWEDEEPDESCDLLEVLSKPIY